MSGHAKPLAALSLDLDNQWSYMMTHGDPGWEEFPSYLETLVPRVLSLLDEFGLKITFFVVGQDAALGKNRRALEAITANGHEVANHSLRHEQWMSRYSSERLEEEIASAEQHILEATGCRPSGFRGPGFCLSSGILEVLSRRGYLYDATTFPTFIGPAARAYYFLNATMTREQREKRQALFGGLADVLRPIRPYRWDLENGPLLEIPTTTMPLFRVPFHLSYILYIASFSVALAANYLRTALLLCRAASVAPSFLLHPLDFLGCDDGVGLGFFPGMQLRGSLKCDLARRAMELLCLHYSPASMSRFAVQLVNRSDLALRRPSS
jgi:hypothetical protein